MKITFTGISKSEAIDRLEKTANEERRFAARIGANSLFASVADKANARAKQFTEIADIIRNADGDACMSSDDEKRLYLALAKYEHTFEASDRLYIATPESVDELPFDAVLAEGAAESEKTNF